MKEVPKKLVTMLAEAALPKCIVPVKYVTKFTAMPSVVNLSITSPPDEQRKKNANIIINNIVYTVGCIRSPAPKFKSLYEQQ